MQRAGIKQGTSVTMAALIAHPTRARALSILAERTASPNEIFAEIKDELDHDLSTLSYHIRKLDEAGVIELVDEKKVRGAVEHFYRAKTLTAVPEEEWEQLTIAEREPYTELALQLSFADATRALEAGTFDQRPDRWLTRIPLLLDEEGWQELKALEEDRYERTLQIKAAAANRMASHSGEPAIVVKQIAMFFEEP
jgi:DNA-binding transcriptional ArsR family regulator